MKIVGIFIDSIKLQVGKDKHDIIVKDQIVKTEVIFQKSEGSERRVCS